MEKIGKNIKRIRKARKLTLTQVALESGYDAGNLSKLERGLVGWSDKSLSSVAKALNVEVRDFFISEDEQAVLALWSKMGQAERSVLSRLTGEPGESGGPKELTFIPDTTRVVIDHQSTQLKSARMPRRLPISDSQPVGRLHLHYKPNGTE